MYPDLADTIALLTRTPAALNALLRDLPESWTHRNEGEHSWSPYEVIGHLIHGEHTDWIPRAKMILEFGESKAFEPFDREAFKRQGKDKLLPELLDDFARLRSENLKELRNLHLQPEDLEQSRNATPRSARSRCRSYSPPGPCTTSPICTRSPE